jgi:hypothetical protein
MKPIRGIIYVTDRQSMNGEKPYFIQLLYCHTIQQTLHKARIIARYSVRIYQTVIYQGENWCPGGGKNLFLRDT